MHWKYLWNANTHAHDGVHLVVLALLWSRRRNRGERRSLWWPDAAPDAVTISPDVSGKFFTAVRGAQLVIELTGHVTHPVTCDRTRPVAVGALWTLTGHRVQRVRSNAEARPVMATVTSDTHCSCLSCSDQTRPITLTGASGQHVLHCVVQ
jgi:hypothetical protein